MAKASVIQTSFNAGEVSPLLEGRVDLGKYANSCHKLENFLPLVQGGTRKRSGTRFVKEVKDSSKFTRLLPFEFGTTQAYILEFGNLYMRVYRDGGAVLESSVNISGTTAASPVVVTTATAHEYATGDEIFIPATGGTGLAELDNKFWEIIVTSSTQFSLTGSPNPGATSSEGTVARVFTLVTPYPDTTLDSIQFAQSADVLYIAHPDFNPRKLQRTAHTAWSLSIIEFDWVPFEPQNVDSDVTVHTSAVTGTGQTLTASSPIFTDSMIGSQFKLAEIIGSNHGQWSSATPQTRSGYGVVVDTDDRYFENNVYLIKSISGSAGTSPPIHEFGIESDGTVSGCSSVGNSKVMDLESAGPDFCPDAYFEKRQLAVSRSDGSEDFIVLLRILYRPDKLVETVSGDAFIRTGNQKRRLTEDQKREIRINKGQIAYEKEPVTLPYPQEFDNQLIKNFCDQFRSKRGLETDHSREQILTINHLDAIKDDQFRGCPR